MYCENTSTPTDGKSRLMASAARRPSSVCDGGILMSAITASGRCSRTCCEQRFRVAHRRAHLVAAIGEQPGQALPQHHGVLRDHDTHQVPPPVIRMGSSTVTLVGPPGGLDTSATRRPSTRAARSPASPVPRDGSAPPRPSSLTRNRSRSGRCVSMSISILFAELCLIALASSSAAQK